MDLPVSYDLGAVARSLQSEYGISVSSVAATVENEMFTYGPESLIFDPATDIASGTIEDIVEGTYTVTLKAYMLDSENNHVLIAEGSQSGVAIADGQTSTVNISMRIVVGLGDLVINGEITEGTTILEDDFEDGTLAGDPAWTDGGTDAYPISIYDLSGDYVLKVQRGDSDKGKARTDVDFSMENDNFILSFDTQYFGDSLGRPMVYFYDDSGYTAFRWYANTYQDELSATIFEYDPATETYTAETVCTVSYTSANSNHDYRIEKTGSTIVLYEDDVEMCRGTISSSFSEWNDNLTILELCGHGSGPNSGVYYDDVYFKYGTF